MRILAPGLPGTQQSGPLGELWLIRRRLVYRWVYSLVGPFPQQPFPVRSDVGCQYALFEREIVDFSLVQLLPDYHSK